LGAFPGFVAPDGEPFTPRGAARSEDGWTSRPPTIVVPSNMNRASQGAPFAVCREIVSSLNHLGHLYAGTLQSGPRFRAFMDQVLGRIDPNYRRRGAEIYEMYRYGTVHEFDPKVLENKKGQTLA
jgi:hypothetical protein